MALKSSTLAALFKRKNQPKNPNLRLPKVVVVGAGFGGLSVARVLAKHSVEVILFDHNNYHGFWPLLYQVATAELLPDAIAFPIREITSRYPNLTFYMTEVKQIDLDKKQVVTQTEPISYDYLVLAAGSTNNYFGSQTIPRYTYSLKDVDQAVAVRQAILSAFEKASFESDPDKQVSLLTFVVVGAGPTGVELSAALAELVKPLLAKYYPTLNKNLARVVLVEAHETMLDSFPKSLQKKAQQHLKRLGVELRPDSKVADVQEQTVYFKDGSILKASTVIWAAGVKASPLAQSLKVELVHGQRVPIEPTLNLKEHPQVFVIGDMAYLEGYKGKQAAYPGVAQVAIQMGQQAAHNILAQVRKEPMRAFHYFDKGNLATIGRRDAVADIFGFQLSGLLAWLIWAVVHIYFLLGVRNRLLTMLAWIYNYFTYNLGTRLLGKAGDSESDQAPGNQQELVDF